MDSADAANLIAEIHEERAENEASKHFRNRAALLIAVLAAVLAIGGLGGGNATDDMIANNIKASDTWAFFQAKNIRQTMYKLAVQDLEIELTASTPTPSVRAATESRIKHYHATIARYDSEPAMDAQNGLLKGEGKRELTAQAKAYEAAFAQAAARDNNFDFAEVALQLALVLGSVAILALNRWILVLAAGFGSIGALLTINGFALLVRLP